MLRKECDGCVNHLTSGGTLQSDHFLRTYRHWMRGAVKMEVTERSSICCIGNPRRINELGFYLTRSVHGSYGIVQAVSTL